MHGKHIFYCFILTEPIYSELVIESDPKLSHQKPLNEGMGFRENPERTCWNKQLVCVCVYVCVCFHLFSYTENLLD